MISREKAQKPQKEKRVGFQINAEPPASAFLYAFSKWPFL
jgi:hypothetical protein